MKKILFLSILLAIFSTTNLFSKSKISHSTKTYHYHWKQGTSFLGFLKKNGISQKLYYNLDADDKELFAEVKAGQLYTVKKSRKKTVFLIPVTDELQIEVIKNKRGKDKISLKPIPFETLNGSIHLKIKHSWKKDLYAKTHSKALIHELKESYDSLNLDRMRKGDEINIFYTQKRRHGKAISSPTIQAAMITINKNKYYSYLADDGHYYDSTGKEYKQSIVIKKINPKFIRPVKNYRISSGFTHSRYHPILHRYRAHLGIDYATRWGSPIRATASGKIIKKGWRGGYGRCISIKHSNEMISLYAHMSKFRSGINVGKYVKQGTIIGYVGSTGVSTGPHLHFGLYKRGRAVNPARYIQDNRIKKTVIVKKLKGKEYRKLRRKVVAYRRKFKRIIKTGGTPIYVKNGVYLLILKEKKS